MNILKLLPAIYYKLAFRAGLSLAGTEEGRPLLIGSDVQFSSFDRELEANNL